MISNVALVLLEPSFSFVVPQLDVATGDSGNDSVATPNRIHPWGSLRSLFRFLLLFLISPGNYDAANLGMESAVLYPLSSVLKLPITTIMFQGLHGRSISVFQITVDATTKLMALY